MKPLTVRPLLRLVLVAAVAAVATCSGHPRPSVDAGASSSPAVLLVSIDGFRPDYLDPEVTPNLVRLAESGVRAEALIPSFPTKTFPNHYTLVTGLRPDSHGLVANNMWDPDMQARFGLGDREAVGNADWYGGEPVWVTAERHGMTTATLFWPGSEAPIGGVRPTHWKPYDGEMPHRDRVEWVLARLAGEEGRAVGFATLYFDDVDAAGHEHGPRAPETRAATARVDSALGYLLEGLESRGLGHVNLIVVSDHGMSPLSRDRVIFLDDYLDPEATRVVDWDPVLALWPDPTGVDSVYGALQGRHPHLHVYRREEIPERYEFGSHDRVAPIIGIADPGWSITTHDYFERNPGGYRGGNHGYDQMSEDMQALFVAAGPAFRRGAVVSPFPNVDVYELIMHVLGLPPAPGDGRLARTAGVLATAQEKPGKAPENLPRRFHYLYGLSIEASVDLDHVLRLRTPTFLGQIELDHVALFQRTEAIGLNLREVNERIPGAVIERDESEALVVVEPFHGSRRTRHPVTSPAWTMCVDARPGSPARRRFRWPSSRSAISTVRSPRGLARKRPRAP
jgi:predicted AlkP superfamily pyrophosphatase or phosphodiesterase